MKKVCEIENLNISSFIQKLSRLLEDPRIRNIINWNEQGDAIRIDSHNEFLETMLAQYFNHTKISSFVRQLNLYGFRKISERGSEMIYKHPHYIRQKAYMHKMIKRKRKNKQKQGECLHAESGIQNPTLEKEKTRIKGLEEIYFRIKKENQKIDKQNLVIKSHLRVFSQIKHSKFFFQLNNLFGSKIISSNQKIQESKKVTEKGHKSKSDSSVTRETSTNQLNQVSQRQNFRDEFMEDNNYEDQMNENDMRNQIQYLKQNSDQISCQKNSDNEKQSQNFWDNDQMNFNQEEFQ